MTAKSPAELLRAAGYLPRPAGTVLLDGPAALLLEAWRAWLRRRFRALAPEFVDAPALIAADVLDRAGYRANFPQHLVEARGIASRGRSFATPAACLHVYPALAGSRISAARTLVVEARCTRHEGGRWRYPYRLQSFGMIELVVVGSRSVVERRRAAAAATLAGGLRRLGVEGEWRPATDPFFGDGARALQKLMDAKHELTVAGSPPVALASSNRHGDRFGRAFRIRCSDGGPAFTACVAVGLERLVAHSLLVWGPSPSRWPRGLRR